MITKIVVSLHLKQSTFSSSFMKPVEYKMQCNNPSVVYYYVRIVMITMIIIILLGLFVLKDWVKFSAEQRITVVSH